MQAAGFSQLIDQTPSKTRENGKLSKLAICSFWTILFDSQASFKFLLNSWSFLFNLSACLSELHKTLQQKWFQLNAVDTKRDNGDPCTA